MQGSYASRAVFEKSGAAVLSFPMPRASLLQAAPCLVLLAVASTGCRSKPQGSDRSAASGPAKGILADTGFRPGKDGYRFENQGGAYPRTPPVLTSAGRREDVRQRRVHQGGDANCKLKPVATEWMGMVNRAMNAGQCEGMAVSSLAFYKKVYNPASFAPRAKSVHDLTHAEIVRAHRLLLGLPDDRPGAQRQGPEPGAP